MGEMMPQSVLCLTGSLLLGTGVKGQESPGSSAVWHNKLNTRMRQFLPGRNPVTPLVLCLSQ